MHTFLILFVIAVAAVLSWFLVVRKQMPMERVVLAAVFIFGLLTNIITLPGLVPDEPSHIETAYRYANVWLGKPYMVEVEEGVELFADNKGIAVRRDDLEIVNLSPFHEPSLSAYQTVRDRFDWFSSAEGCEMVVSYDARAVECGFMGYLPSSIGMALARILCLGMYPMLYLGRIMNLVFYSVCIYWAVRLTPVKKWLFGLLALTPMAMQLACSYSYDSPLIGMSFLTIAWGLKLIYETKRLTGQNWLFTCILAFLLIPCKMTICPFLPLLLIPSSVCGGKGKKALFLVSVVLSGLLGLLPQYTEMFAHYLGGVKTLASDANNQRSTPLYTLGWILQNPKETVQIFLHSIRQNFTFYWTNMLGGRLAVFEPVVDWTLMLLCTLLLASGHDPDDRLKLSMKHRILFLFGFLLTFFSCMLLMMFMWTPIGSEIIEGVQGRYFLPVLPLLFLFVGMNSITLSQQAKRWLTTLVLTFNSAAFIELLMWIRSYP